MFTPIKVLYTGELAKYGGRPTVEREVDANCVWNENYKRSDYDERILGNQPNVQINLVFEAIPEISLSDLIKKGDLIYIIKDIKKPALDLGLDGTYTVLITESSNEPV